MRGMLASFRWYLLQGAKHGSGKLGGLDHPY